MKKFECMLIYLEEFNRLNALGDKRHCCLCLKDPHATETRSYLIFRMDKVN